MNSFTTISPVDGSTLCERDYADQPQIENAIETSHATFHHYHDSTLADRQSWCRDVIAYFTQHADDIAGEITWQMGRPRHQARGEINGVIERAEHMIAIAESALAPIEYHDQPQFTRFIQRAPLGTVLVLAPWNYPYLTAINTLIPAILAGNSVILKHASQTPLCAERFQAAFDQSGAPKGLFQHLFLSHDQVSRVILDQRIRFVAFTGSVAGGLHIQQAAQQRFIPMGLELGGKDPAYVRADADLGATVTNLVDGAFYNSGQSCCGIERIYVHHSLYNQFIEQYAESVRQYQLGHPEKTDTTLGPMVSQSAASRVQQHIDTAISHGATPLIDPTLFDFAPDSAYLPPQVLINVNHGMSIMTEETFGPVVGIMPVTDDDEAIQLMNDSDYGLSASIWTQDKDSAIRLGNRIETGTVFMNRCDYLDPALAWTGVKNTGRGYTLSPLGLHQLTQAKSFHLKHTTS